MSKEITILVLEDDHLRKILIEKYFRKGITQVLTFKEEDRTKVLEALYNIDSSIT